YWEVSKLKTGKNNKWVFTAKGGPFRKWYGSVIDVINWSVEARDFYKKDKIARIQNTSLWFREGITWNLISSTGTGFRILENDKLFNKAAPTLLFDGIKKNNIYDILGFLNSSVSKYLLKLLNPTFNTNIAEVLSLPYIENNVKGIVESNISISKIDWDSRETSWDFEK